ncbi:Aminoacyl tRNA synthetase class I [Echinococcus multilocularis]|uniref:Aminoacyl tRNA synthetase class I n=1 Tax=Echinococcus multilocularis TaxID=6211 RepID=A0A087VXN1_ECHMU|nr:Aminoacyl tRNA synthetase class I [Echinococcus multilocularis]
MISLFAFTVALVSPKFGAVSAHTTANRNIIYGNMTTAGLHDFPVLKEGIDSTLPQLGFDRPKRRRTHQPHTVILFEDEKVRHQPVTSEDLFTRPQEISYSEDHLSCREELGEYKRTVLPVRPTNGIALPVIPTGGVILKSWKNAAPGAENKAPGNQNGVPPTRPKKIPKRPDGRTSKSEIAPASDKPRPITPDRPLHHTRSKSLGNAYGDGRKCNRQEQGNVPDGRRSRGLSLYEEYQVTGFKKQPLDNLTEDPNNDKAVPRQKPSTPTKTVKNGADLHKEQRKDISSEKKERDNMAKRQSDACEYQNLPASTCARTTDSQPSAPQGLNNTQHGRDSEVLVSVGPSELPTVGGADAEEEDEKKKKKKAQQNTGKIPSSSTEDPNNGEGVPGQKTSTQTETVKDGITPNKEQRKEISPEERERGELSQSEYCNLLSSSEDRFKWPNGAFSARDCQPDKQTTEEDKKEALSTRLGVESAGGENKTSTTAAHSVDGCLEKAWTQKHISGKNSRSSPHSNSSTILAYTNASNTSMGGKASPKWESTAANKASGEYAMPVQQCEDNAAKSQSDAQSKSAVAPRHQKVKPGGVASSQLPNSRLAAAEEEGGEKSAQHNMREDHKLLPPYYKKAEEGRRRKSRWYQMGLFGRHRRPNSQASKSEGDLSQAVDGSHSRFSKTPWQRVRELFIRKPRPTLDSDDSAEEEQQQQQQQQHQRPEKKKQNEPLVGQDESAGKKKSASNPLKEAVGTIV